MNKTSRKILLVEVKSQINSELNGIIGTINYEFAAETRPDVVLLGIDLLDSDVIAEKVAELSGKYMAPVVCVSENSDEETFRKIEIANSYGVIFVPANASAVRSVIEVAISRYDAERQCLIMSEKHRSIINKIEEGVIILDEDFIVRNSNRAASVILEIEKDKMLGCPLRNLDIEAFLQDFDEQTGENWKSISEWGEGKSFLNRKLRLVGKSGIEKYLSVNCMYVEKVEDVYRNCWICDFKDITEQHNAEELLRTSEDRFKSLFRNAYDGYVMTDEAGNIIEWNSMMEQITGLRKDVVKGMKVWDVNMNFGLMITGPDDRRKLREEYKTFYKTGEAPWLNKVFEFVLQKYSGEVFTLQKVIFPFKTRHGWALCSVNRDITELLQQRQARYESENRLRLALNATNDAVWDINPTDKEVLYLSPKWFAMLGYLPDKYSHDYKTFLRFIHPDDLPKIKKVLQDVCDKIITTVNFEVRLLTRDNKYKWVLIRGKVDELDQFGKVVRLLGTNIDIDTRKKAEVALREAEQQLTAIISTLPIGITMIRDEKFVWVNQGFTELLGYSEAELIGNSTIVPRIVDDEAKKILKKLYASAYEQPKMEAEITLMRKDRSSIDCLLIAKAIEDPKLKNDVILVVMDITERKTLLEQQEKINALTVATEKMERETEILLTQAGTLASVGVIASSFTHEINQPLNAIRLGTDGLIFWNKQNNLLPEFIAEMLNGISEAAYKIDTVIKQLRRFCIDQSKSGLVTVDLNLAVQKAVSIVLQKMHNAEIRMIISTQAEHLHVKAIETYLELMINTLLVNAASSLANVVLHDKWVEIHTYSKRNKIYLEVSDNGNGLLNLDLKKVFNVISDESDIEGGKRGLGLSIVKMYAQKFGAEVFAEKLPERGERFSVVFAEIS